MSTMTLRVTVTATVVSVWLGVLAWAVWQGELAVTEFADRVGPMAAFLLGYWFREMGGESQAGQGNTQVGAAGGAPADEVRTG